MRWLKLGAVQVGCLLGLQQLGVERLGGHQESQPQAGRQHLGERAQVDAALGVARGQGQRRRRVEPQVAVGVVLDDGQAQFGGAARQRRRGVPRSWCGRSGSGSWAARRGSGRPAPWPTRSSMSTPSSSLATLTTSGSIGEKACKRAQVGGRLDQDARARVDQHLGNQVQALLRAGGDQHLRGIHLPGQHGGDHFAQRAHSLRWRRIAARPGRPARSTFSQAAANCADRKGLGRGQATGEADDAGALGDLEDFADHRRIHLFGAPRQSPSA